VVGAAGEPRGRSALRRSRPAHSVQLARAMVDRAQSATLVAAPSRPASSWLGAVMTRAVETRGAGFGLTVAAIVLLVAAAADVIAPYTPNQPQSAGVLSAPGRAHMLGTDQLGRDVLSRVIYGTRTSVQAGVVSVGFALVVGVSIGLLAGYAGGWMDDA